MAKEEEPNYKLLFIDIETSPLVGYSWRTWETSLIRLVKDWHLLSFAYKFRGDKKVTVVALPDFPKTYKKDKTDDSELAKKLWELLNEADCVVAHNGDRFDIPKIRARLLAHGLPPPSPFKSIDTCAIAKRWFGFTSNKLGDLGVTLGLGAKEETGGFDLWLGCLAGNMADWRVMIKYNRRDVDLLEAVYDKLKAWSPGHPNIALVKPRTTPLCPTCGSNNVVRRGFEAMKNYRVQRFKCNNPGCGRWSKGTREKITGVKPLV